MEVHAHTHTERKKWSHYLWEFLMLFLAVFFGFLAEYQLEHILEHQRGKQYASTMLEDLKADKNALESGVRVNKTIIACIDTLLHLYHPGNNQTKTTGQLYFYGRYALGFWYYVNKEVTLEQMKHSGTIRYFQNSSLEKQMVSFDKAVSFINYWDERDRIFNAQAINYSSRLFNYAFLPVINNRILDTEDTSAAEQGLAQPSYPYLLSNPPLVNKEPELIIEFLNFCNMRIAVLKAKVSVYENALLEIEKISAELRKDYHLN